MQSHCFAFPRFQAEVWPGVVVVLRARAPGQAWVGFPPPGRIGVHVACFAAHMRNSSYSCIVRTFFRRQQLVSVIRSC